MGIVNFDTVTQAAWLGLPDFHLPANPFAEPSLWG